MRAGTQQSQFSSSSPAFFGIQAVGSKHEQAAQMRRLIRMLDGLRDRVGSRSLTATIKSLVNNLPKTTATRIQPLEHSQDGMENLSEKFADAELEGGDFGYNLEKSADSSSIIGQFLAIAQQFDNRASLPFQQEQRQDQEANHSGDDIEEDN